MLGRHRLVVDEWAEVYDLLRPYADETFWQWSDIEYREDSVYIIGRVVLKRWWYEITSCARNNIIFCNPAEGSDTIKLQLRRLQITNFVCNQKMGLICSGDLEPGFHHLSTDAYFCHIVDYIENQQAHERWQEVYAKTHKPYEFLMLNGRLRPHRKWLIDRLRQQGLLDRALWTNLDTKLALPWTSELQPPDQEPLRLLPPCYEIADARNNIQTAAQSQSFVKHQLFEGHRWGDAIVNPEAYIDTYFSLVTETIFDYPYSFRTEKIYKPMIMCHPFVVAANAGYYRDLRNVGFRTFGHLIDETFDTIDNVHDRAGKIVSVVQDICRNGAADFLSAARDVCEYNYQHLLEYDRQQREELPMILEHYLDQLCHADINSY